ncbi:MAG: hypothetical protein ACE5DI_02130 [Candidatus Micrarchaeia archaeon]
MEVHYLLILLGLVAIAVEFVVLAFSAKSVVEQTARRLHAIDSEVKKLHVHLDKIDEEKEKVGQSVTKKVGKIAFEKMVSEALDFLKARRPA